MDSPRATLARRIRELRGNLSQEALARRIQHDRTGISRAESPTEPVPSPELISKLDHYHGTDGELAELRRAVVGEVSPTDRRELFEFGAAGLLAAKTYRDRRDRAGSGPDALTLWELTDAVNRHAAAFTTTPHTVMAEEVYETWRSAKRHLDGGKVLAKTQTRLEKIAGYSAYMMCRLSFNLGATPTSRQFLTLAGDHAEQVDDPVLTASVAEMMSTLAFYGHAYQDAADEARRGAAVADNDYTRARLAAYEARALAAMGDATGARAALDRMNGAVVDRPARPGASPFSAASADMFAAGVLARIGAGREAEPLARAAIRAYDSGTAVGFEEHGHALLGLSAALLARDDPEPEEAAALAGRVVDMLDVQPTASVTTKIRDVDVAFRAFSDFGPVRDYRERLDARPRLALPAAAS